MTTETQRPVRSDHPLDALFRPRSIAIAGVSASRGAAAGRTFLAPLQDIGFDGPLYLIHPTADAIRGVKCYRSLRDVPESVDYVISSVPARSVSQLLDDCIATGVKFLHLYTSGFSETGDEAAASLERDLIERARAAGIRVVGPNGFGIYAPKSRVAFYPGQPPLDGPVSIVSQSGTNAIEFQRNAALRGVYPSKVISFGNGSDLGAADYLEYLATDPDTGLVTAYLEGIKDGRRLARAMRDVAARKPLVILKGGETEAGSIAATSHTASMAGSDKIFDALCRQVGAVRVRSAEELVDAAVLFNFVGRLRGPNLALVGAGGGVSVTGADRISEVGLCLPELPPEIQERLQQVTGDAGTSTRNPVDTMSMRNNFEATLRACAEAENVDAVLYHTRFDGPLGPGANPEQMRSQAQAMARIQEETGKALLAITRAAPNVQGMVETQEFVSACAAAGVGAFPNVERAARALAHMLRWQQSIAAD